MLTSGTGTRYGRRMPRAQPNSLTRTPAAAVLLSLALDVVGIFVFCTIGRRAHAEGITLHGVWQTAWPFLAGAAIGWLLSRGWSRPTSITTGITVWVCTVLFGMILRQLNNQGVAFSFVVVASVVTALFLLGWRAIANRISPR